LLGGITLMTSIRCNLMRPAGLVTIGGDRHQATTN